MRKMLQRCIDLIEETGDRLIVYNEQRDKAYVLLSLEAYERMQQQSGQMPVQEYSPQPAETSQTEFVEVAPEQQGEVSLQPGQSYHFESVEEEQEAYPVEEAEETAGEEPRTA